MHKVLGLLLIIIMAMFAVGYFSIDNACMQTIDPNLYSVDVSANSNKLLAGGDSSVITVQLYYDGTKSSDSGVTVHFESSNPSVAWFDPSSSSTTDNGVATQLLKSLDTLGSTTVRAYVDFGNSTIKEDSVQVTVVPVGEIIGIVRDKNGASLPNARVSLWAGGYLLPAFDNPQMTSTTDPGKYRFYRIPYGQYLIKVKATNSSGIEHETSTTVNLNSGTITTDIAFDVVMIDTSPVTVTPSPDPTQVPVPTTTPTTVPTQVPTAAPTTLPTAVPEPVTSDSASPVTTLNTTGVSNGDGIFNSTVICTLSAQDNPGGSGVSVIQYSFDGSVWNNYTSPFTVTRQGVNTIFYKSLDENGNAEVVQVKSITISSNAQSASPTQQTPAPSMAATITSIVAISMWLVLAMKRKK
jgi:hypothetical protein